MHPRDICSKTGRKHEAYPRISERGVRQHYPLQQGLKLLEVASVAVNFCAEFDNTIHYNKD